MLTQGKITKQVAEEQVKAENERYKHENCAGMSAEACAVKMYIHINDNSIPSGINRVQFNRWRPDYWKQRANDFK